METMGLDEETTVCSWFEICYSGGQQRVLSMTLSH